MDRDYQASINLSRYTA
ncbi:MAG: hypothetical protein FWC91_10460 [Defluviitaleaceae bacterium]|nr:hypothetical protein [Defluviitaleaceae bacterium]